MLTRRSCEPLTELARDLLSVAKKVAAATAPNCQKPARQHVRPKTNNLCRKRGKPVLIKGVSEKLMAVSPNIVRRDRPRWSTP